MSPTPIPNIMGVTLDYINSYTGIISSIGVIFAIIFSIIALIISIKSSKLSGKILVNQILFDLHKEYGSPEMLVALRRMYNHYKNNGEDFLNKYIEIMKEEDKNDTIGVNDKLDCQRRLVKKFYQYLTFVYKYKLVPKKIIFRKWKEKDLRIIVDIIIPIELLIYKRNTGVELEKDDDIWDMEMLYDDSKKYTKTLKRKLKGKSSNVNAIKANNHL